VAAAATTVKPAVYGAGMPQLSEEQRCRAEAAVARKFGGGGTGTDVGVGAKLMARMGFGAAEGSRGGLGINEHVCCIHVMSRSQWCQMCLEPLSLLLGCPSSTEKCTSHLRLARLPQGLECIAPQS